MKKSKYNSQKKAAREQFFCISERTWEERKMDMLENKNSPTAIAVELKIFEGFKEIPLHPI